MGELKIGIEDLVAKIPNTYISSADLAVKRKIDPLKFSEGLGIRNISILDSKSLIELGSDALVEIILRNNLDSKDIDRIYVATESSIDESRSLAEYIIELTEKELGKNAFSHIEPPLECKQACISSSVALNDLCRYSRDTENLSILICADEAKYDLYSSEEPTQGCGILVVLIKNNPSLIELDFNKIGCYNTPMKDFYRPFGKKIPIVDGKLSNFCYLYTMRHAYDNYVKRSNKTIDDFNYFVFHTPYPKMSEYAAAAIFIHHYRNTSKFKQIENMIGVEPKLSDSRGSLESMENDGGYIKKYFEFNKKIRKTKVFRTFYDSKIKPSIKYIQNIGNIYTGSILLCLASLIENDKIKENSNIGFGAYGSGASALFYGGKLKHKRNLGISEQLVYRRKVSIEEYQNRRLK